VKSKIIILAAIVVGLAGLGWYARTRVRGAAQAEPRMFGNVDIREVDLGFRVSGKLKQVLRDEGDEVKAGEVLAVPDDEPYRRELEQAKALVESLRARVQLPRGRQSSTGNCAGARRPA